MKTIAENVANLTKIEQSRLFGMLTDHADLLVKVLPELKLINFIHTGNFGPDTNDPLIQAYLAWKKQQ